MTEVVIINKFDEGLLWKYSIKYMNTAELIEFRLFMRHSIQLFHTFLCNSQNYHPRVAVDDPMSCCPRPKAEANSSSGHPQHRGGDNLIVAQTGMK